MRDDHAGLISAMGASITPELVDASQRLYAADHPTALPPGVTVTRDQQYGPDERNRLDVFAPPVAAPRPVLLYVHGGGFVRGDKRLPGTPYYDNVGRWAARQGHVGVTMTYRLAPAHRYPAAAADVGLALGWLRANAARFGGDPDAIVLVGQSAGAAHAAMYAARRDLHPGSDIGVAGIVLLSGIYDFASFASPTANEYLGDDAAHLSSIDGLLATRVPVMMLVAELDPPAFHAQAKQLADALFARDDRFPNVLYMARHNHISQIAHLDADATDDPLLATRLAEFVRTSTARDRATT